MLYECAGSSLVQCVTLGYSGAHSVAVSALLRRRLTFKFSAAAEGKTGSELDSPSSKSPS